MKVSNNPLCNKSKKQTKYCFELDHGGLNSIQQWDTPAWQKPITNFFQKTDKLPSIEPKHKEYAQPSQSCDMNDIEMKAADANDVDMQDKENTPPSTSKADVEIGENSNNNSVSNKRGMSDDEEGVILNYMVVPPKKPKLDAAMFQDVEEFE